MLAYFLASGYESTVFSTYGWKIAQSEDTQETRLSASAVANDNQLSVGWMKSVSLDVSSPPRCSVIHLSLLFLSKACYLIERTGKAIAQN